MTKITKEIRVALTLATDVSFEVNVDDMVNFANKVDSEVNHVHQEIFYLPENFIKKIKPLAISYLNEMNINYNKIMNKLNKSKSNDEKTKIAVEYILSHMDEYTHNRQAIFDNDSIFDDEDLEVEHEEIPDDKLVEIIAYNVYGKLFDNKEDAEFEKERKDEEIKEIVSDMMKIQDILAMAKVSPHTISIELNNSYKQEIRKATLDRYAYIINATVKEELNSYYVISAMSFCYAKVTESEMKEIVIDELKELNKYSN